MTNFQRELQITTPALEDLSDIFSWTEDHFGQPARMRYSSLIELASQEILNTPDRLGCKLAYEDAENIYAYHLRYSSSRLPKTSKVAKPRHFLIFTLAPQKLMVLRVLHDSMDIEHILSEEDL
jgi:toxin ParE1/3/4